jgi:hypothetical protein
MKRKEEGKGEGTGEDSKPTLHQTLAGSRWHARMLSAVGKSKLAAIAGHEQHGGNNSGGERKGVWLTLKSESAGR